MDRTSIASEYNPTDILSKENTFKIPRTAPLLHQNTIRQIFWNILSRKETFEIPWTGPLLHQNNQNAIPEMFLECSVLDLFDLAKTQGYQG